LVEAAIADNSYFRISTVEIDRLPPHYAYETVRILAEKNPGCELIYLMGGDSLGDLPEWKEPQIFIQICSELGVMHRPGENFDLPTLEVVLPVLMRKVRFVDAPSLDISSIDLRERIKAGKPVRYYLPPAVYEIIVHLKLYQD
jgi:nicotinate-nucleotide adenylyltransferase